jgi:hypothetical protein
MAEAEPDQPERTGRILRKRRDFLRVKDSAPNVLVKDDYAHDIVRVCTER